MTSTLIVRDALTLVRGEPRGKGNPDEYLRSRIGAAKRLKPGQVEDCCRVLAISTGEEADLESLEAALILALAHPKLAEDFGLNTVALARTFAVRCERGGDSALACAVLRVVSESFPGNLAIERTFASLMRRQGMVHELVERYLARARRLLESGATQDAIPWLREVLQLDRSRKDVARMIRDLRFDEVAFKRSKRLRVRAVLFALVASLGITLLVLREDSVRKSFEALPAARGGDAASLRARLASLEEFISANPVWHGALTALRERSELRVEIDRLNTEEMVQRELRAEENRKRDLAADSACVRARNAADAGDFETAVAEFKEALELGSEGWPNRGRAQRDMDAIVAYLAERKER